MKEAQKLRQSRAVPTCRLELPLQAVQRIVGGEEAERELPTVGNGPLKRRKRQCAEMEAVRG